MPNSGSRSFDGIDGVGAFDMTGRARFDLEKTIKWIAAAFVTFWASWTVYCQALVFLERSFNDLVRFSFLPLFAFIVLMYLLIKAPLATIPAGPQSPGRFSLRPLPISIATAICICIPLVYYFTESCLFLWVAGVLFLLYQTASTTKPSPAIEEKQRSSNIEMTGLIAITLLAVVVTMITHRPDLDDSFYLNMATSALDFKNYPLLKYDLIHGIPGVPIHKWVYRLHSYELFTALLSWWADREPVFLYYLILPPISAVMVIFAHWLVLRKCLSKTALLALVFVFIVFLTWGDAHRTPSNFAFVRLFQGKAVAISALIPLIVFFAMEFVDKPNFRNWLLLGLTQTAAVGFTSSALVAAPVASFLVLLGSWRPNRRRTLIVLTGSLASLYFIAAGVYGFWVVDAHFPIRKMFIETSSGLNEIMGTGVHQYFALACLLALGIRFRSSEAGLLPVGFGLTAMFFLLSPWTSFFFSRFVVGNFYWRIFWALPFPLVMGLAVGGLMGGILAKVKNWKPAALLFAGICVLWTAAPGTWTISKANQTRIALPRLKVYYVYDTVKAIKKLTPAKGMVLANEYIACWLPTLRDYPYVVTSRKHYLRSLLPYIGKKEIKTRLLMHAAVSGEIRTMEKLEPVIEEIEKRNIDTIVVHKGTSLIPEFISRLKKMGYVKHDSPHADIWVKTAGAGSTE